MARKNVLKMVVFISIAMFVLIPLLSSPVAARANWGSGCSTDNSMLGPTAQLWWDDTTIIDSSGAPYNYRFTMEYYFTDTSFNTQTPSSAHYASITVTPAGGSTNTQTTNIVYLNKGQSTSGTLIATGFYSGPPPSSFTVELTVWCRDIPSQQVATQGWIGQVIVES